MSPRRPSPRRARVAAVLLAVALALAAAEVALRLAWPELGLHASPDALLGWSSAEYRRFDPAAEPPPRPGRRRILFLGDSNLAGAGIEHLDQRFAVRVAERLPEADVRVLASGGWGPDQEALAFLQKGRAWRPDLVVLAFTAVNDPANVLSAANRSGASKPCFVLDEASGALALVGPDGEPLDASTGGPERGPLLESRLLDLVRLGLARLRGGERGKEPGGVVDPRYLLYPAFAADREELVARLAPLRAGATALDWAPQETVSDVTPYVHEDFPLNAYAWRLTEHVLELLRDEVRAAGAGLDLLLLPIPFDPRDPTTLPGGAHERVIATPAGPFTFRAAEPEERLAAIAARLGVELLDPVPDLAPRLAAETELVWPDPTDTHLSPHGHRLLAEWLAPRLAAD